MCQKTWKNNRRINLHDTGNFFKTSLLCEMPLFATLCKIPTPLSLKPVNQHSRKKKRSQNPLFFFFPSILRELEQKPYLKKGRMLRNDGQLCSLHCCRPPDEQAAPQRGAPPANTHDPADCKVSCRLRETLCTSQQRRPPPPDLPTQAVIEAGGGHRKHFHPL